ncbi:OLC1v1021658C6 [Oldenlandia corymbosa var. corymbosa]|uniref:OLC1v1021658C6 n=1 Tax=Oldenlandia corymbosa var. corymbosa TaxID=529605 RepID=A0AAV1BXG0_OLDCO|nr:OLC1v1021658C6 [Oldenlandia corymbosa var. corymbosa]
MKAVKSWRWLLKKALSILDRGTCGSKMKPLPFMLVMCTVMLFIVYRTTTYQYRQTEMESRLYPFYTLMSSGVPASSLRSLPRGIIEAKSDLELKPLWSGSGSKPEVDSPSSKNLLAIPVGIKQMRNVDRIVRKFLPANFTIVLFHYDGNVDGWWDLVWSKKAIHMVAFNQTKWWFAKRFLHPAVVSSYDYIFLWDEDLGVEHFHPGRYLEIIKSEGLEISQPALDPNSTGIHHRITIRRRTNKFHRRVYDTRGSWKCSDDSEGPPCTGFVEGMAPVFSRAAWHCAWHLIQVTSSFYLLGFSFGYANKLVQFFLGGWVGGIHECAVKFTWTLVVGVLRNEDGIFLFVFLIHLDGCLNLFNNYVLCCSVCRVILFMDGVWT